MKVLMSFPSTDDMTYNTIKVEAKTATQTHNGCFEVKMSRTQQT